MKERFLKIKNKLFGIATMVSVAMITTTNKVFAAGNSNSTVSSQNVESVTKKIVDAVKDLAMPIGAALIFIGVVLTAIRIAVHHNNPKERTENISSLGWLVVAALILGASLLIAGLIIKVTSNNGSLYEASASTLACFVPIVM